MTDKKKDNAPKPKKFGASKYLLLGSTVLLCGGMFLGYSVGHRQGLTAAGYAADAAELMEVVQTQKDTLATLNKNLNMAIQERDISISNVNNLNRSLTETKADLGIAQTQSLIYREILRQRGGVSLTVQNLGIRPLPENAYEYQIDLLQVSPSQRRVSGNVELRLIRGEDILVVPMENKAFSFDNFERLTGRWTMPKGFVPQFIEVRLSGGVSETKRFSWLRGKEIESSARYASEVPQATPKTQ